MKVKTNRLKCCPCCGNHKPELYHIGANWKVYCSACPIHTEWMDFKTEVIKVWNRRA